MSSDLAVLTLFVTSVCNARCGTCFYWHSLNQPKNEMSMDEWARIAATVPRVRGLQLSGGEPTLDPHLVDKVALFVRDADTSIALPTNAIRTKQVVEQVANLTARFPKNRIIVGISIDGPAEVHDHVRGVKDNYAKAMQTLDALNELKRDRPNLRLSTLTCLLESNIDLMFPLLQEFADSGRVDYVTVEPLRDQKPDETLRGPAIDKLRRMHALVLELNTHLLAERHPREMPSVVSHIVELFRTQQVVRQTGLLDFDCQAGFATGVLEASGTVRLCELLEPIGNIREYNCDWPAIWNSEPAQAQRRMIRTRACSCTHCVNVGQSIPFDRSAENRRQMAEQRLAAMVS